MAKIKVSPTNLKSTAKKIEKDISEYETIYQKMVTLIDSNQGGFDQATLAALQESCRRMESKFKEMKDYLAKITLVIQRIASAYEKANSEIRTTSSNINV